MNRLTVLICLLTCGTALSAQVLLDKPDFSPEIGDTYVLHTIDYVEPGKSVIWDLSEVSILSSNAVEIIAPEESPFAQEFAGSELCYDLGNGEYMYYSLKNNAYANTGAIANGNLIRYSDPRRLLKFPLEFGDGYMDSYQSQFSMEGIRFERSGSMDVRVIDEGTAIFPFGIMDNVIKIRVQEDIEDRFTVMGEESVLHSRVESYYFLAPGSDEFIMSLHINEQDGKEVRRYGTLLDKGDLESMLVMNAPLRAIHTAVAADQESLDIRLISEWTGELKLSLYDLKGKEALSSQSIPVAPGKIEAQFDWESLAAGTYVINLELDDRLSQLKVVKEEHP